MTWMMHVFVKAVENKEYGQIPDDSGFNCYYSSNWEIIFHKILWTDELILFRNENPRNLPIT